MAGGPPPSISVADDTWKQLAPGSRILAGAALALANYMAILDMTVANVSVPHLSGDLGVSLDQGAWVITSYAVAEAICVPLTGWLAQRFGTVRVLACAIFGFSVFSLLCGLAMTLPMLVAARIGQGLCGGPLLPMSQTLMMRIFPPDKRVMAMGVWAMTITLGPVTGPIIGGIVNDYLSWHWVFFINVPIAVPCMLGTLVLLRPFETPTRRVPIDRVGLALMVFTIACLQLMLDLGRDRDWFANDLVLSLGIAGAIGLALFIIWELTEEHPIVNLRVFRHRGFTVSVIVQSLAFGAFFSGSVILPQWTQATLGYPAMKAGIISGVHAITAIIVSRFVPGLIQRLGTRPVVCIGCTWLAFAAFIRSFWPPDIDMLTLAAMISIQGFGNPMMFIPLVGLSTTTVDRHEAADAAGLVNFIRTMAMALATSVSLSIWSNAGITAHADMVGNLDEGRVRATLAGTGLGAEQTSVLLEQMVTSQSVTMAVNYIYGLSAVVFLAAAALIWLAPAALPVRRPPAPRTPAPAPGAGLEPAAA